MNDYARHKPARRRSSAMKTLTASLAIVAALGLAHSASAEPGIELSASSGEKFDEIEFVVECLPDDAAEPAGVWWQLGIEGQGIVTSSFFPLGPDWTASGEWSVSDVEPGAYYVKVDCAGYVDGEVQTLSSLGSVPFTVIDPSAETPISPREPMTPADPAARPSARPAESAIAPAAPAKAASASPALTG